MRDTRSTTHRGRPRGFDEEQVLVLALDLFWRKGYDKASLAELSAVTNLSPSSIYNTYSSKLGMFLAALDLYLDLLDAVMLRPVEHGEAGLADIELFFERIKEAARHGGGRGCLVVNTVVEFRDPPEPVRERIERYRQAMDRALLAALRRAIADGAISPENLTERVDALSATVMSANILIASGNRADEAVDLLRAVLCLVRAD